MNIILIVINVWIVEASSIVGKLSRNNLPFTNLNSMHSNDKNARLISVDAVLTVPMLKCKTTTRPFHSLQQTKQQRYKLFLFVFY